LRKCPDALMWSHARYLTDRSGMRIIIAILVTVFIGSHTPVHINNSTPEQHHEEVVVIEPSVDQVEVANQTPTETVATVVETEVQEQTLNQAQANVTLNPVSCEEYRHLVEQYDWDIRTALAVMKAESGCNPEASNWSDNHRTCIGSFGLFQIGCIHHSNISDLYSPEFNVQRAYQIYQSSGWGAWGAYNNKSYMRYL